MEFDRETEVIEYAHNNFSPEKVEAVFDAITLLADFELSDYLQKLTDVLFDTDRDNSDLTQGKFIGVLCDCLKSVIETHRVYVVDDHDLTALTYAASVIRRIQDYEDVDSLLTLWSTDDDPEQQFAAVGELLTDQTLTYFLDVVATVDPTFRQACTTYLETKVQEDEDDQETKELKKAIMAKLKAFFTLVQGDTVVKDMFDSGVPVGVPIKYYYAFIGEHLLDFQDLKKTARNLLGVFLYASDTTQDALLSYRRYSLALLPDDKTRSAVETMLQAYLQDLQSLQGALT